MAAGTEDRILVLLKNPRRAHLEIYWVILCFSVSSKIVAEVPAVMIDAIQVVPLRSEGREEKI